MRKTSYAGYVGKVLQPTKIPFNRDTFLYIIETSRPGGGGRILDKFVVFEPSVGVKKSTTLDMKIAAFLQA